MSLLANTVLKLHPIDFAVLAFLDSKWWLVCTSTPHGPSPAAPPVYAARSSGVSPGELTLSCRATRP